MTERLTSSSVPVRASREPQKADDGKFHPRDFYRAGLLRAAEIADTMKLGPWGDPHDAIKHEHLVEQIVAAIEASASPSDDGAAREPGFSGDDLSVVFKKGWDAGAAELAAARARIVVLETSVDSLRYLIDHPVTQPPTLHELAESLRLKAEAEEPR